VSVRVEDLSLISDAMARLRESPPATLAGREVTEADDLSAGLDGLPPSDVLRYRLSGGGRAIVRPSGTEPKLKAYLEVVVPVTGSVEEARTTAAAELTALRESVADALGL
jgi:phosphomannomutase